jgi:hypothetical protein
MKCAVHPEAEATAYCRNCGKALCPECTRTVQGMHYCEACLAALVSRQPAAQPSREHSPMVAFFLGLIPGLGAVYNGEYTKALVHVAIFVGLVSLDSTGMQQPLFGLLTGFFCLYMPIEAAVTATNMQRATAQTAAPAPASPTTTSALALAPPEQGSPAQPATAPVPVPVPAKDRRPQLVGPVILILIGAIFLLDNLGWMDADRVIAHAWPLVLIALGFWLFVKNRHRPD